MRVLVTGATGFMGTQMIKFLSTQNNIRITGLARKITDCFSNVQKLDWVEGDILNLDKIVEIISDVQPDAVLHLAGLNHGSIQNLHKINVTGTQNILDATLRTNPDCRVLVISSSAVYGYAGNTPIAETQVLKPLSEYGVSKAAQDALCQTYYMTKGSHVTVARPFNLVGPYQPSSFVCGRIVQQVIEIEYGKRTCLDLFEIQSSRDFIDVRDVVKANWALVSHKNFEDDCSGNAFNIGSGKTYTISSVIDLLQEITGTECQLHLSKGSSPIPIPSQMSNNTQIQRITGWKPQFPLKESLSDMLNAARRDPRLFATSSCG